MNAVTSSLQRIWDAPTRLMHGLLAVSFLVAWLTAESERWQGVHVVAGHVLAATVVLRLVWGVVGTRHARFAGFVHGPAAVWRYLKSLTTRQPEHHSGHNPAGGWAIVGLLGLGAAVAASGLAMQWLGESDALQDLHEAAANAMLLLVGVHLAGVLVGSWRHRENLARAMIDGRKRAPAEDAIAGTRPAAAAAALALVAAVAGIAAWQHAQMPAAGGDATEIEAATESGAEAAEDDD